MQRHDGWDCYEDVFEHECLKKHDCHLLSIDLGVQGGFSHKATKHILWIDSELIIEGVMPYFFHGVPVINNTVFYGLFRVQDTSPLVSLVPDIVRVLIYTLIASGSLWLTNDGRKDDGGVAFTTEAGFQHC